MRNLFLQVVTIVTACGVSQAYAQSSGPHSHGVASVSLALDGQSVMILFEAPGADLVGFERAPNSDTEKAMLDDVIALLENSSNVLRPDPSANCVQQEASALAHGFEAGSGDKHAEFEVNYVLSCSGAPSQVELSLFTTFTSLGAVDLEIIGPSVALDREVNRSDTTISW